MNRLDSVILTAADYKRLRDEAPPEWRHIDPPPLVVVDGQLQIGNPEQYGVLVLQSNAGKESK